MKLLAREVLRPRVSISCEHQQQSERGFRDPGRRKLAHHSSKLVRRSTYKVPLTSAEAADRPRERLQSIGPRGLADAELLALVIGRGCRGCSALDIGRRLVRDAGSLRQLGRRQLAEWGMERGIGAARAAQLAAVFEIARRIRGRAPAPGAIVQQPADLARYLMARYGDDGEESFGIILLDGRNRFVRELPLSRGGWTSSVVRPREVFRQALLAAAPAIVLFHNHPSGDPTPSREDVGITRQVREAGDLLGIRVLDHLVVGAEGFVSLRERGLM